ncbi:anti-sigma factor family protein [Actinomadura sp. HBU206391]|uniref:anti-sigma factor family protein n=1 Tax=Actinomadura sp. HBU206391 TaxID=2731692 RepID=UPI0016508872|nr:zf-HC2 domain-containing protein [Actinomadura sp. HBU206391]MBC6460953.1 zf-HC2 domain-containing protein [Actinomadura sp. HBU206391]
MSDGVQHTDVGAYALGLLDDTDRELFELHLARCDSCVAEFTDLSGMRQLFSGVSPVDVGPSGAGPFGAGHAGAGPAAVGQTGRDLPVAAAPVPIGRPRRRAAADRRRAIAERRRRRGTAILGAAAGVALLAGGVTIGIAITGQGGPVLPPAQDHGTLAQDLLNTGERRSATDPTTRVAGTVAMETKGWGTHVALDLSRVRGPLVCRLVAVTRGGDRRMVTEWTVHKAGYGLPGSPAHLAVHGGTASLRSEIVRFEVETDTGRRLLTIPV